ncbi:hypothetical protein AVEN_54856-1 [Araneus ventricosus]|uniref:Tc1-like transposase DDE domain-containing protein n=1 Tax=Araneus ventricosus TaxID=182803 RepID=A0A4Y2IAA1_ARAVE|nr:hypothetical protein AVEN_54856-1 [Araneus ventricosus]
MHDNVIGPTFFAEPTVTSNINFDMLQLYAVPQFPEGVIFQQDGAPPHYGNIVRFLMGLASWTKPIPQTWFSMLPMCSNHLNVSTLSAIAIT